MKQTFTRAKAALATAFLTLVVSGQALAQQTAGDAAEGLFDQLPAFANLATAGAFLVGIFMGILALLKFKAYNENPQQTKISTPIILMLVAAGLIGLPSFLNMSKETVLQGEGNSLSAPVYDQIGG